MDDGIGERRREDLRCEEYGSVKSKNKNKIKKKSRKMRSTTI
jgi:hypothetical protein